MSGVFTSTTPIYHHGTDIHTPPSKCLDEINIPFIHSLEFSPRGRSGRNQGPVMEPIWLLAHCILGKFLGVVCHCFPLDVPTFAATCLCVLSDARDPSSERWNCGREICPLVILPKLGIFYMGPTALLPLFRPKNPTVSAGSEPANLGTKGQHATSRTPKPPC